MKINIDDLQKITFLLLSRLKDSKGNEVEVEHDFYWNISEAEIYDPYIEPKTLTLGQLSDEWNELTRLKNSAPPLPHDIGRIAAILKALSIEQAIAF